MSHSDDTLILLAQYPTLVEASIVKGMLEDNGIPAIVNDGIMSTLTGSTSPLFAVRLYVRRSDADEASKLLSADGD